MAELTSQREYWCFISYRHADNKEPGRQWATWLHQAIETYEVPEDLVGTTNQRGDVIPERIFPVFRDEEELPADADLSSPIYHALDQSKYLLAICSPCARQSLYVNNEIQYFKQIGRSSRVLAAMIAGEPNASLDVGKLANGFTETDECFPMALQFEVDGQGKLTTTRTEPIAANFRVFDAEGKPAEGWTTPAAYRNALKAGQSDLSSREINARVSAFQKQLEKMKLKIVAGILGVPLGELTKRDQAYQLKRARQRQRILIGVLSMMSVLAVAAISAGILAWNQKQEAEASRIRAETEVVFSQVRGGDIPRAMGIASQMLETNPETTPSEIQDLVRFWLPQLLSLRQALPMAPAVAAWQGKNFWVSEGGVPQYLNDVPISRWALGADSNEFVILEGPETNERIVVRDSSTFDVVAESDYEYEGQRIVSTGIQVDGSSFLVSGHLFSSSAGGAYPILTIIDSREISMEAFSWDDFPAEAWEGGSDRGVDLIDWPQVEKVPESEDDLAIFGRNWDTPDSFFTSDAERQQIKDMLSELPLSDSYEGSLISGNESDLKSMISGMLGVRELIGYGYFFYTAEGKNQGLNFLGVENEVISSHYYEHFFGNHAEFELLGHDLFLLGSMAQQLILFDLNLFEPLSFDVFHDIRSLEDLGNPLPLSVDPTGRRVAIASSDGSIRIYDRERDQLELRHAHRVAGPFSAKPADDVAFRDYDTVIVSDASDKVWAYSISDKRILWSHQRDRVHADLFAELTTSPDGRFLMILDQPAFYGEGAVATEEIGYLELLTTGHGIPLITPLRISATASFGSDYGQLEFFSKGELIASLEPMSEDSLNTSISHIEQLTGTTPTLPLRDLTTLPDLKIIPNHSLWTFRE